MELLLPMCFASVAIPAVAVFIGLIVYWSMQNAQRWREALQAVAADWDLQYEAGGFFSVSRSHGAVDGNGLEVDSYTVSTGNSSQTFTRIRMSAPFPKSMNIDKEGVMSVMLGQRDIQLGVPRFDEAIWLQGHEVDLISRLSSEARRVIEEWKPKIVDGKLELVRGGLITDKEALRGMTRDMVELTRQLTRGGSTADRLSELARTDPEGPVRYRAGMLLLRHYDRHPDARTIAEAWLDAPSPRLRFECARVLGHTETLRAIVEERDAPVDLRARAALEVGGSEAMLVEIAAALDEELEERDGIVQLLDSESSLLSLLETAPRAVARRLGVVGTVASVQHLLPYSEGVFRDGAVKRAAREAVAAIQGRVEGGEAGMLSLPREQPGGALSLAEDRAGQLAVAQRDSDEA